MPAARAIDRVEDDIYLVVAILLIVAGLFARWGAVSKLVNDVQRRFQPLSVVTDLLDNGLMILGTTFALVLWHRFHIQPAAGKS